MYTNMLPFAEDSMLLQWKFKQNDEINFVEL